MHDTREIDDPPKLNLFTLGDFEYIQSRIQDRVSSLTELYVCNHGRSTKDIEQMKSLLDRWLRNTFSILTPNILINGLSYEIAHSMNEAYEPRSLELVGILEELSKKRIELFMKVLKLRNQIPAIIYDELLKSNRKINSEFTSRESLIQTEDLAAEDDVNSRTLTAEASEKCKTFSEHYLKVSDRTKELSSVGIPSLYIKSHSDF